MGCFRPRPDEDLRGGFKHGGWALPFNDEVMFEAMGERMAKGGSLLLGRRTYKDFYAVWPQPDGQPLHRGAQQHQEVRGVDDAEGAASVDELHFSPTGERRPRSGLWTA